MSAQLSKRSGTINSPKPWLFFRAKIASLCQLCCCTALLFSCGEKSSAIDCAPAVNQDAAIEWKMAFPSLPSIAQPIQLFQLPDNNRHWYALRQPGVIVRFANQGDASTLSDVLDIQDRVSSNKGGETGLLGVAVHPQFASNRYIFIYYTGLSASNELESRVARYTAKSDGSFDKNSELILLRIARPFTNHVGGHLAFDQQGYLYISSGDGGSAGDPGQRGQNLNLLLGKILRIDVDNISEGRNYAIPKDNPFINIANVQPEIWAWGLRNPWRFSFDRLTQELWAGDVGQHDWEEINIISSGGNYGWGDMEGDTCFKSRPNCSTANKIKPIYNIAHDTGACSVIGGYVYRGARYPQAYGKYFFTDFCENTMRSLSYQPDKTLLAEKYGSRIQGLLNRAGVAKNIVSFAEDNQGELYAVGQAEGVGKQIYTLRAEDEMHTTNSSLANCSKNNALQ